METVLLLAQAQARGANPIISFLPLIFLFILFWVMIIVPQRRQAKEHANMVGSLQKGDQIVTAGGLIGEVTGIKNDEIQVKTGTSIVVVERAKIARRLGGEPRK
ncbi:MAG TPA: preprotein translocase subunit YajC [Longimicrobium sp.]|jgi:preprotein translocase subunit YajC|uniref:preprotein translocase subunit YajC n=1 Tax=Longimicrobium sp. TaxID=2029185 RepID=UPI002EDA2BBE